MLTSAILFSARDAPDNSSGVPKLRAPVSRRMIFAILTIRGSARTTRPSINEPIDSSINARLSAKVFTFTDDERAHARAEKLSSTGGGAMREAGAPGRAATRVPSPRRRSGRRIPATVLLGSQRENAKVIARGERGELSAKPFDQRPAAAGSGRALAVRSALSRSASRNARSIDCSELSRGSHTVW